MYFTWFKSMPIKICSSQNEVSFFDCWSVKFMNYDLTVAKQLVQPKIPARMTVVTVRVNNSRNQTEVKSYFFNVSKNFFSTQATARIDEYAFCRTAVYKIDVAVKLVRQV